jgi:uncharacterized protein YggU (UPF0235/DUF167 family)
VEGAANAALVDLLASRLDVPRSAIRVAAGDRGRHKRVTIAGLTVASVRALLSI